MSVKRKFKVFTQSNKLLDSFQLVGEPAFDSLALQGKREFLKRNKNLTGDFVLYEFDDNYRVGTPLRFTVESKNVQRSNLFSF
jgi:hypothetical protein